MNCRAGIQQPLPQTDEDARRYRKLRTCAYRSHGRQIKAGVGSNISEEKLKQRWNRVDGKNPNVAIWSRSQLMMQGTPKQVGYPENPRTGRTHKLHTERLDRNPEPPYCEATVHH